MAPAVATLAGGLSADVGKTVSNACSACQKICYPSEKIVINEKTLHKACFRCSHCKNQLTLSNFAVLEGIMYCKPHFKSLFKEKGSYNHITAKVRYCILTYEHIRN